MQSKDPIIFHPIGVIKTPHKRQQGTPIQPFAARGVLGQVEIFEPFKEALNDLQGFDRIWLLFWCHQAKDFALRVVPYRDTVPRGLFSTRSPSRPNSIGLSAVRLRRVDLHLGILEVEDVDMLDGTPLLDIKPYVPRFDNYPDAKAGWLDEVIKDQQIADDRFAKNKQNK